MVNKIKTNFGLNIRLGLRSIFRLNVKKNLFNELSLNLPLLYILLSILPLEIQIMQGLRFKGLQAGFEFATWIPIEQEIFFLIEATQRGFCIWYNKERTGLFLYGAGNINDSLQKDTILWLQNIKQTDRKTHIMINRKGEFI